MRRALAALSAFLVLSASSACTHTVIIDSDPTGAEIKVNGEKVGVAPTTYNETTGWEKVYDIEVSKPGYKTTRKQIKQTEWNVPLTIASAGPAALTGFTIGLPCLVGLLWARQLPDRVVVVVDKSGPGVPGSDPGTAAPPSSYGY
jgi:hypothetical protein